VDIAQKTARPEERAVVNIRLIQLNELSVKVACVDADAIDADRADTGKAHLKESVSSYVEGSVIKLFQVCARRKAQIYFLPAKYPTQNLYF